MNFHIVVVNQRLTIHTYDLVLLTRLTEHHLRLEHIPYSLDLLCGILYSPWKFRTVPVSFSKMVIRKPLPPGAQNISSPPYPSSPIQSNAPTFAFNGSQHSKPETENVWAQEELRPEEVPPSLQAGAGRHSMERSRSREDVPESLRVGHLEHTPRSSGEMERPSISNTNPFLKKQNDAQDGSSDARESSAGAWGSAWSGAPAGRPPIPTHQPPPPPVQNSELTMRSKI